jgi:hypothetical protein
MDIEVESQCGGGYHEKFGERQARRNGYLDRRWLTRALRRPDAGSWFSVGRGVPIHSPRADAALGRAYTWSGVEANDVGSG